MIKDNSTHTIINLGQIHPVLKEKIIAIAPAPNKDLWVATATNGLVCINNNQIKYQLTLQSGLTSNVCRCLYLSKNIIWLGTDKGICKIDITSYPFKISRFTGADGLDCEIINCIYATGDSVFVGTPFGITFFNANQVQNKSICELKLVDIQSKNYNWFYKQDSIRLKSNDNFIRFEYAGISFVSSGDITYYYQLEGLDSTWQSYNTKFS